MLNLSFQCSVGNIIERLLEGFARKNYYVVQPSVFGANKLKSETNPADKPRRSVAKLVLFGFLSFALLLTIAGAFILAPVWDYMFPPGWKKDFSRGVELWKEDHDKGEVVIKKAFADAEAAKAPIPLLMSMHRDYARVLYDWNEDRQGDEQIALAISICPKQPPKDSLEADLLTHAYQDRGWDKYNRFLHDRKRDSGEQDMEQSVLVAEKAFGPDHEQTIYKIPSLAVIYDDTGKHQQSDVLMKRAIDAATNVEGAKECAWFVHSREARICGLRHEFKKSVKEFVLANSLAKNENRKGILMDLDLGISQGDKSEAPLAMNVDNLFSKEKFAEIDKIADEMRKNQSLVSNGCWQLDEVYGKLEPNNYTSESDYTQHFFEYKKWRHDNPNSVTAKVSYAQSYVNYAWFARGGGYSDSVTQGGWTLFAERLKQAKAILDTDPSIKSKCPRAYYVYAKIALGQSMPKDQYISLLDECHKKWPNYRVIDNSACWFFLPRWYGDEYETEKYINKRADQVGGAAGDERCAQMVWFIYPSLDSVFHGNSPLKWKRTQAGFQQIFSEFPRTINPRIAYIRLALLAHDDAAILKTFDNYPDK